MSDAAAVPKSDMDALAHGKLGTVDDFAVKSLTAVLLSDRPQPGNELRAKEFQFLPEGGQLLGSKIMNAIQRKDGSASMLKPEHIRIEQTETDSGEVRGVVVWSTDWFRGQARFEARHSGDRWTITGFILPVRQLRIFVDPSGEWKVDRAKARVTEKSDTTN